MRVAEVMSQPAITIPPTETVGRARQIMRVENIHHLVMVEHHEVLGVILAEELEQYSADEPLAHLMGEHPVVVESHTTIREAANLLRGHGVSALAVVDGKKLVGVLTINDLLELLGRGAIMPSPRSERVTLKNRGPRRKHLAN